MVDDPGYAPEAAPWELNSREYTLQNEAGINDHGDEFKSAMQMEKGYNLAKKGCC